MKVGVVSSLTDRGIGIQSWEAARNLGADVLFVETKDPSAPSHPERAPGATRVRWAAGLDPKATMAWLRTVDVVYAAETFYDSRLCAWARQADTLTVLHANPEFYTGREDPDLLWSATAWRKDVMPARTEVVPFPVATDRFQWDDEPHFRRYDDRPRWVHVAGKRALADRNGTDTLMAALPLLKESCHVTVFVQHGEHPRLPVVPPHVRVHVSPSVPANYWDLYRNADALVLPRRYGGLCLPAQEACAAGLAVLMSDLIPNRMWPGPRVPAEFHRKVTMPCGRVPVYDVKPSALAAAMDELADPAVMARHQAEARAWAQEHSWETLGPRWLELFAMKEAA